MEEVDSWRLRGVVLQYNLNLSKYIVTLLNTSGENEPMLSSDIPIACENVLYHYLSLFKLAF